MPQPHEARSAVCHRWDGARVFGYDKGAVRTADSREPLLQELRDAGVEVVRLSANRVGVGDLDPRAPGQRHPGPGEPSGSRPAR